VRISWTEFKDLEQTVHRWEGQRTAVVYMPRKDKERAVNITKNDMCGVVVFRRVSLRRDACLPKSRLRFLAFCQGQGSRLVTDPLGGRSLGLANYLWS
jgi:hypothetical protein